MNRANVGREAEVAAENILRAKSMTIIERNFQAKVGEIDIVAKDKDEIVFVEVRLRSSLTFGGAAASVDRAKRRKLIKAAHVWLQARSWTGPCRFDVFAWDLDHVEHIPSAFDAGSR